MRSWCVLVFMLLQLYFASCAYKSYSGYQVFRTAVPRDEHTVIKLNSLSTNPDYDFWTHSHLGQPTHIMTSSDHVDKLKTDLNKLGLEASVLIPDLAKVIEKERNKIERLLRSQQNLDGAVTFENFMTFHEIDAYLREVVATYPEVATLIDIGTSYEGRPLKVLKLSSGPGKTGMWMDAAIHAREWAGPPVVLYAINQLTKNLVKNQAMLDKNDFFFLPVANPDGYLYSWSDERFWRKNRSPTSCSCIGTDLNRNFDWHWEKSTVRECSYQYAGSAPFSESESQAIANFLSANPDIKLYLSVHAYGQYILYPHAHTTEDAPDTIELNRVGKAAADALASVRGTEYTAGSIAEVLYLAFGTSQDWSYSVANISLSYTIELPAGGVGDFNPPPEDILPVVTETWEAVKVFAQNIPSK